MDHCVHCGLGHAGGGEVETVTVPLKPLALVKVMVDVAVPPAGIVRELGFAVMVKSDAPGWDTTVKVTLTECDSEPLVPCMDTV